MARSTGPQSQSRGFSTVGQHRTERPYAVVYRTYLPIVGRLLHRTSAMRSTWLSDLGRSVRAADRRDSAGSDWSSAIRLMRSAIRGSIPA